MQRLETGETRGGRRASAAQYVRHPEEGRIVDALLAQQREPKARRAGLIDVQLAEHLHLLPVGIGRHIQRSLSLSAGIADTIDHEIGFGFEAPQALGHLIGRNQIE